MEVVVYNQGVNNMPSQAPIGTHSLVKMVLLSSGLYLQECTLLSYTPELWSFINGKSSKLLQRYGVYRSATYT